MKKLILIFLAVMPVLFTACEKEENKDPNAITKENIVGKWNVTESYVDGKWTDYSDMGWYVLLNSNNNYTAKMGVHIYSGTWTLTDKRVTCEVLGYQVYYDFIEFNGKSAIVDISYDSDPEKERFKAVKE